MTLNGVMTTDVCYLCGTIAELFVTHLILNLMQLFMFLKLLNLYLLGLP